jgi:hypothetical protein
MKALPRNLGFVHEHHIAQFGIGGSFNFDFDF